MNEDLLVKYLLNELTLKEREEVDSLILSDSSIANEVDELRSILKDVKYHYEQIDKSMFVLTENHKDEISMSTYLKPTFKEYILDKSKKYLRIENPYLPEFIFILAMLTLAIIEIRDLSQFKINNATMLDQNFSDYTTISFLCCLTLLLYVLTLMKRIRKEIKLVEDLDNWNGIGLTATFRSPLALLKILYIVIFIVLILLV